MKKNPYYYLGANPTCDLVVVSPEDKLLFAKRSEKSDACPSEWALTGGFINTLAQKGEYWLAGFEEPKDAAKREAGEETNLILDEKTIILPVGVYEGNQRDPRDNEVSWSKSHAFFVKLDEKTFLEQCDKLVGQDDVELVGWFTIEEALEMKLAFDHSKILHDALTLYMKEKLQSVSKHKYKM